MGGNFVEYLAEKGEEAKELLDAYNLIRSKGNDIFEVTPSILGYDGGTYLLALPETQRQEDGNGHLTPSESDYKLLENLFSEDNVVERLRKGILCLSRFKAPLNIDSFNLKSLERVLGGEAVLLRSSNRHGMLRSRHSSMSI